MRLNYLKFNQKQLRSELYSGLQDAVHAQDSMLESSNIGQQIILPSSFTGGPRQMHQLYQDGMAIVRVFGKPDLFITMTCNPQWPEITNELLPGQMAQDRPDLIARVFNMKLKVMLGDILKDDIFGKVIAYLYTIEFQKPEIPDRDGDPYTFDTVKRSMIHGPCGAFMQNAPCMKNGRCPKHFQESTAVNNDGYPIYKRRDNGKTVEVRGATLDNRWVVPYNPYLSTRYDCHINVEICSSITAVKYLFKYVYKGHDRATVEIRRQNHKQESNDEISLYLDARYVSASEASWRLFHYRLHDRSPAVVHLQVHLPGQHRVIFRDDECLENVVERANSEKTTLTAWFQANTLYPEARELTYGNFPTQWVYNRQTNKWSPRQHENVIGRMYFVSPMAGKRYYLRILLNVVCGATSFENLHTVNGVLYNTFKEACAILGLLQNGEEWDQCLAEAAQVQTGSQLRNLFATLLLFCDPVRPENLWEKYFYALSDDMQFQVHDNVENTDIHNRALTHLQSILNRRGKCLKDFPDMPIPEVLSDCDQDNYLIYEEQSYNIEELTQTVENGIPQLNADQKVAFEKVITAVENQTPAMFFIDGPGGTGKTFLYNVLLAKIRLDGHIALAIASSGIAALLLPGGRTAHSRFRIPINLNEDSTCSISHGSDTALLLQRTSLIAPMMHRYAFEAVDRTLKDLMKAVDPDLEGKPFGVVKGGQEEIVGSCLRRSPLWKHVEVMKLKINMRLRCTTSDLIEQDEFARWLLKVGEGHITAVGPEKNIIQLPDDIVLSSEELTDLTQFVYSGFSSHTNSQYLVERAILAPKNDQVNAINDIIMTQFPGDAVEYLSADMVEEQAEAEHLYPVEFLNSLTIGGLPPHRLILKPGAPIILLRNISPSDGLCNGTRLVCRSFNRHVIEAEIITGKHSGNCVFLPRITMTPSNTDLPFIFKRRQFPVQPAFAMTINKSQGQTLNLVGLYLPTPVFSHGQLYVACSRVTSRKNLKILTSKCNGENVRYANLTSNIVYPEVLQ
ncbi:4542_t:CDS:2 [Entrophospora sp. SA101]|nr:4542_t:CDS:2 [Entrophospora sp. SA101]CAJ0905831.1 8972_t:CDS:2 [Entrophospora sp. SA101]